MKEIERRFQEFQLKHPHLGDVIVISMVVEGMHYGRPMILKAFNKLVSKEEYDEDEKKEIINHLESYSYATK